MARLATFHTALLLIGVTAMAETVVGQSAACAPAGAPRSVTRGVTLGASLPPAPRLATYPELWRVDLLHRWVAAFTAPPRWTPDVPTDIWTQADEPSGAMPFAPAGQYVARIKRNGRIDRVRVERKSGSPALDSAVILAFRRVDSLGGFGELPEQILRSRAEWRVVVGTAHPLGRNVIPLAEDSMRIMVVDTAPLLRHRISPPIGTTSASVAGGGFVVEYIVSASGRVDPATIRVLWSSSPDIAKGAIKAARSSEYRPGYGGGCPVPVAVVWRQQLGAGPYDPSADP